MTPSTLLLRQVHPGFVQAGRITSQVFRPTPKDEGYLSVDNGDLITPQQAWQRFTANPAVASAGIMAVTWAQCAKILRAHAQTRGWLWQDKSSESNGLVTPVNQA
jgi:hypothetical protein